VEAADLAAVEGEDPGAAGGDNRISMFSENAEIQKWREALCVERS
jgi:hypothetical protein